MIPVVSIIMPAYKTGKYISLAIQSILNQTYSEWELIVIDDGSPDSLAMTVENFINSDQRIRLICQENAGVSAARNRGIETARGEYIAFLDSDDIWDPRFLEKTVELIQRKKAQFVYSGYIAEDDAETSRRLGHPYSRGNILSKYCIGSQKIWICGILVKLELLKKNSILFSNGGRFSEDIEFILKILASSEAEVVKEELVRYKWRRDSATNIEAWSKSHEDTITALNRAKLFVEEQYQGSNKEEILMQISFNQATQMSRLLWGAIKNNEQDFVDYLFQAYPEIIHSKALKLGHTARLFACRNSFFRELIQKFG